MLAEDEIEMGVITADQYDEELSTITLVDEEIVLCVAQGHPWAREESVAVRRLDEAPMVLYETDYFIRRLFDSLCEKEGVTPDVRLQTGPAAAGPHRWTEDHGRGGGRNRGCAAPSQSNHTYGHRLEGQPPFVQGEPSLSGMAVECGRIVITGLCSSRD